MSCQVYSVIAVALSIGQATSGLQEQQPSYELGAPGESSAEFLFGVFNAIATVCFAWGGHNVALVSWPCKMLLLLLLHQWLPAVCLGKCDGSS
jgi:hypothetical protein